MWLDNFLKNLATTLANRFSQWTGLANPFTVLTLLGTELIWTCLLQHLLRRRRKARTRKMDVVRHFIACKFNVLNFRLYIQDNRKTKELKVRELLFFICPTLCQTMQVVLSVTNGWTTQHLFNVLTNYGLLRLGFFPKFMSTTCLK